jgi:hypothetical protein
MDGQSGRQCVEAVTEQTRNGRSRGLRPPFSRPAPGLSPARAQRRGQRQEQVREILELQLVPFGQALMRRMTHEERIQLSQVKAHLGWAGSGAGRRASRQE